MPRPKKPWFRVYTETLHDRKLRRLPPESRWAWIAVLSIARQSPRAGALLLDNGKPALLGDIADEAALSEKETKAALDAFIEQEMLANYQGVLVVVNWHTRQFESDDVTSRANASRERNAAPNDEDCNVGSNVAMGVASNSINNGVCNDGSAVASDDGCNVTPRTRPPARPRNRDSEIQNLQSYREDIGPETTERDEDKPSSQNFSEDSSRETVSFGRPFVKPTWEQVQAHFAALHKPEQARLFWLHYEEKRWVGVVNWAYKAEMWIERRQTQFVPTGKRGVNAPSYPTGSLDEQLEAMRRMDEQIEAGGLLH